MYIYIYIYVTGPGKTGLIYTKYTCLYYGTYLLFCMCYPKSVNLIEFFTEFCIYDDIIDMIQITYKTLLHFKLSKSGQILHVDKTYFPRPGHIYIYIPLKPYFKDIYSVIYLISGSPLPVRYSYSPVQCLI